MSDERAESVEDFENVEDFDVEGGEEIEPSEASEADAAEQRVDLRDEDETAEGEPPRDDVNPADVVEQRRNVPLDEDDYR